MHQEAKDCVQDGKDHPLEEAHASIWRRRIIDGYKKIMNFLNTAIDQENQNPVVRVAVAKKLQHQTPMSMKKTKFSNLKKKVRIQKIVLDKRLNFLYNIQYK